MINTMISKSNIIPTTTPIISLTGAPFLSEYDPRASCDKEFVFKKISDLVKTSVDEIIFESVKSKLKEKERLEEKSRLSENIVLGVNELLFEKRPLDENKALDENTALDEKNVLKEKDSDVEKDSVRENSDVSLKAFELVK